MSKLFIIGNGFDISHGLPTKYSDFQNYLKNTYPDASEENAIVPASSVMPDGDEVYDDNEVVSFLLKVITEAEASGENWNNLETTLGKLEFNDYFDDYPDDESDDNEWHWAYNNEDIAVNICGSVMLIKKYFADWINTIDINCCRNVRFSKLIDPDGDVFFTFNYTDTLEKIYGAKNVYHIHGKQGEEIVFGHGDENNDYDSDDYAYIGTENYLNQLHTYLKKDTKAIIMRNENLFQSFAQINEIYSYGFSFSDVDMVYIKEICNSLLNDNVVWYIHRYNSSKFDCIKSQIEACGFKGQFKIFEC